MIQMSRGKQEAGDWDGAGSEQFPRFIRSAECGWLSPGAPKARAMLSRFLDRLD